MLDVQHLSVSYGKHVALDGVSLTVAAAVAAVAWTVLGGAAVYALQILAMERFAPRYDPLALTFVEMAAAAVGGQSFTFQPLPQ